MTHRCTALAGSLIAAVKPLGFTTTARDFAGPHAAYETVTLSEAAAEIDVLYGHDDQGFAAVLVANVSPIALVRFPGQDDVLPYLACVDSAAAYDVRLLPACSIAAAGPGAGVAELLAHCTLADIPQTLRHSYACMIASCADETDDAAARQAMGRHWQTARARHG